MADDLHHTAIMLSLTKGMALVARPCQHEAAAKASQVTRWRVGRVQMQHRWYRRVLCRLLQLADAGALCAVLFCCRDVTGQKVVVVLWALGQHAHIAQHVPRTRWTSRPGGVDSQLSHCFRSLEHTHLVAAAEEQRQRQQQHH